MPSRLLGSTTWTAWTASRARRSSQGSFGLELRRGGPGGGWVGRGAAGQAEEGVLEPVGGDLEVAGVGLGEQVAGHEVAVLAVHVDLLPAHLDVLDPADPGQGVDVRPPPGGAHGASRGERLDLAAGAVSDDG